MKFYKHPLLASYMREFFGMKFEGRDADGPFVFGPWFIHHDSLPILEPQVGDVAYDVKSSKTVGVIDRIVNGGVLIPVGNFVPLASCIIIWRNGISFIWPEEE